MSKINLSIMLVNASALCIFSTALPMARRQLIFWSLPALHKAVHEDNLGQVRALIPTQNINEWDEGGCTPLHYAIRRENLAIIRELLARGADINRTQSNGVTVAQIANGYTNVAWYIHHVAPRIPDFLHACQTGNIAAVQAALQWHTPDGHHGIDVNATRPGFMSPLHYAIINAGTDQISPWIRIVRTLIARHALVNTQDAQERTPLYYAIWHNNAVLARYLISHQADPCGISLSPEAEQFLQTQVYNTLPH